MHRHESLGNRLPVGNQQREADEESCDAQADGLLEKLRARVEAKNTEQNQPSSDRHNGERSQKKLIPELSGGLSAGFCAPQPAARYSNNIGMTPAEECAQTQSHKSFNGKLNPAQTGRHNWPSITPSRRSSATAMLPITGP